MTKTALVILREPISLLRNYSKKLRRREAYCVRNRKNLRRREVYCVRNRKIYAEERIYQKNITKHSPTKKLRIKN